MTDIWLPGWPRVPLPGMPGKAYQFTHNPKGCLHTTEGSSIAGARAAYAPYPPHLIYDWRIRTGEQHVPLNRAAYSASDGNDDDYMIQIELVGFAADTRHWPDEALRNVATDVIAPLEKYFGIPRNICSHGFRDGADGIYPYISTPQSPIRIGWQSLRDFSGWLGHQHLPSPDNHWDPGALNVARILSFLDAPQEDDMPFGVPNPVQWEPGTEKWGVLAVPPVGGSMSVGSSGEAWFHMRCPNRPVKVHGVWYVHHNGSLLKEIPEFELKQDTYWTEKLPEGCSQVSVKYTGEVPIGATLETRA
jgi:hypothetical protein